MTDRNKILYAVLLAALLFSAFPPRIIATLAFQSRPPDCGPGVGQPCLPVREPILREAQELDGVAIAAPIQVTPITPTVTARRIARGGARTWRR